MADTQQSEDYVRHPVELMRRYWRLVQVRHEKGHRITVRLIGRPRLGMPRKRFLLLVTDHGPSNKLEPIPRVMADDVYPTHTQQVVTGG